MEQDRCGAFRVAVLLWLDGCFETHAFAQALLSLQQHHPKLRAAVRPDHQGRLHFVFQDAPAPIPFTLSDREEESMPWREATHDLLHQTFPDAGPLAAARVLQSRASSRSVLILALHHAVADGASALMLLDELLAAYARCASQDSQTSLASLNAVNAYRSRSSGWRNRARLVARFFRMQREEKRSSHTLLPQSSGVPAQSQWSHWSFTRSDTMQIVRRCRSEKVSLTAMLVAATSRALVDCLGVAEGRFKCQFPFNIREELVTEAGPIGPHDLGCFVGIMNDFYRVPQDEDLWSMARKIDNSLQHFRDQGGPAFCFNMAALATSRPFARVAPNVFARSQRPTLFTTNYGAVSIQSRYAELAPKECAILFNNDNAGPSLMLEALVMGNELNLSLAADQLDPTLWDALAPAFCRYVEGTLSTSN